MAGRTLSGPQRFAAELRRRGIDASARQLPDSTRTAVEAAAAIGCAVAEIAKTVVFRDLDHDRPLLVLASGVNRVCKRKLQVLTGSNVGPADAGFVRQRTGYAIGGVPPFGHIEPIVTVVDNDLFGYQTIWAAAGGPYAVFQTTAEQLLQASGGRRAGISA